MTLWWLELRQLLKHYCARVIKSLMTCSTSSYRFDACHTWINQGHVKRACNVSSLASHHITHLEGSIFSKNIFLQGKNWFKSKLCVVKHLQCQGCRERWRKVKYWYRYPDTTDGPTLLSVGWQQFFPLKHVMYNFSQYVSVNWLEIEYMQNLFWNGRK
jgi:hypothetical protein